MSNESPEITNTEAEATTAALTSEQQEQREEQVRLAAHYLWQAKGKNLWSDKDDWFEAEDSVIEDFKD